MIYRRITPIPNVSDELKPFTDQNINRKEQKIKKQEKFQDIEKKLSAQNCELNCACTLVS